MAQAQALQRDRAKLANAHLTLVMVTNDSASTLVSAAKGYKCTLVMPETMSMERRAMLKGLGADLILTPASEATSSGCDRRPRSPTPPGPFDADGGRNGGTGPGKPQYSAHYW